MESVSNKITDQDAQELKAEVNSLLRRAQTSRANSSKEERKTLTELKKDKDRMPLTAEKEVAMVVLNKEEYIQKVENLLAQSTYKTIERHPTNKIKAKLILILKRTKRETGMEESIIKLCILPFVTPRFYGLPKIHKSGTPLRPTVSSRGSVVTYGVARVLAKVLKPLVGKSLYHIQSTRDFQTCLRR